MSLKQTVDKDFHTLFHMENRIFNMLWLRLILLLFWLCKHSVALALQHRQLLPMFVCFFCELHKAHIQIASVYRAYTRLIASYV